MNSLLNYFIEANLYLICFYALYQIVLVRHKHFRFNRAFLLGGIILSLLLPMVSFQLAGMQNAPGTIEGYIILPAVTITSAQTESVGFILKWWHIIGGIYIAGVLFYLFRLLWQMAHLLFSMPKFKSAREKKDGYTLVKTNGEIPTCSFFKILFWDTTAKLSKAEKNQILEHELVHISQLHSLDVLFVGILRAIFWFNPFIHLIKSNITEVHEYLADHYATREIGVEDYSKLLTLQVFKSYDFAIANNFHKSQVVKRIRMLKSDRSRSLWINVGVLIPMLTLLIMVLAYDVTGSKSEIDATTLESLTDNPDQGNEILEELIFLKVEQQPVPVEGMGEFYQYIQNNLTYPEDAKAQGIEGKVYVQFVVAKSGKLMDVKAVKGIGGGCDEEAVRVVKESKPWNPGSQRGIKVNVRMIMPITFKLG